MKLSSLHKMNFRHSYIIHVKFDIGIFNAITSTRHSLQIYYLDFPFNEIVFPSNSKKTLWSNKFSKYPFINIIFWKSNWLCFLWDLGLQILATWSSHSYTLAYCWPIHLISIEFQNINNNRLTSPKYFFLSLQLL